MTDTIHLIYKTFSCSILQVKCSSSCQHFANSFYNWLRQDKNSLETKQLTRTD